MTKRILAMGLACLAVGMGIAGVGTVSAGGDQVQHTHGEDTGYYDENNNNQFPDDTFPGDPPQNRTGM
ncbi:MAG: hypothetical protein MUC90_02470 [Thermoplasmata archaeon]|jgi:hypothetical protein|nr:hypothetical protein [Thermoplasmata archaeon]